MRLQQTLEKYLPLISNMLAPAAVFAVGLFAFLIKGGFSFENAVVMHWGFYGLNLLSLIILLNFNRGRMLFFMVAAIVAYIALNYLKNRFGEDFSATIWYQNLIVLLPANLLVFYLLPCRRFLSRRSLAAALLLMVEYSIIEALGRNNIALAMASQYAEWAAWGMFLILCGVALFKSVKYGTLFDYSVLFASLSIGCGVLYSSSSSGLSLFFFIAQLILFGSLVYRLIYNYYYDDLTGFFSRNSYLIQSKKFPLKYSLGIVSIDNYDKLAATIGKGRINIVTELIADILAELTSDEHIYRYAPEQFIIIYRKLDKKEAFAELEKIRRAIAGVGFEYTSGKKPLNLTVSCSVSEKKRSDAGAVEVLMRADKAMRKTLKFSHNVTSQG